MNEQIAAGTSAWLTAIAVSLLLQIAVVYVSFLNAAFDTSPFDVSEWLLGVAMASSVVWGNEIWKLAKRRRDLRKEGRLETPH